MKKLLFLLMTLIPGSALAQYSVWSEPIINQLGQPIQGVTVAVCTSLPTTVVPCGGSSLATIFTSFTGGAQINPMYSDSFGRASVFAAAGNYYLQIYSPGLPASIVPITIGGGGGGGGSGTVNSGTLNCSVFYPASSNAVSPQCGLSWSGTAAVFASSVATGNDGVHAGFVTWPGNTTLPTLGANVFSIIGPPVASFTSWGLQLPSTPPSTNSVANYGAAVSGVTPITFFPKPVIDWLIDQTVTTTGDQSTNIVNAWNAVGSKNAGLIRSNPTGNYQFGTSVAPNSFGGYAIEGNGGTGQFGAGANFSWTGGAFPAFNLDRQRDSIVGRFLLKLNAVSGASGLNVTQLTATSGQISSHNLYHDIAIGGLTGAGAIGFNIAGDPGDSANNNEAQTLARVSVSANTIFNVGSTCVNLGTSANARDIGYYESTLLGCGTGFSLAGGSWHVFGGLTQSHNTALSITTGAQGGTYAFVHDENSKQGILTSGSNQYNYLLLGNTYEMDSVDLTKPYWDLGAISGAAVSIANIMKPNGSVTKMVAPPTSGTFISIGDIMPNTTIANLPKLQNFGRSVMLGTSTAYTSGNVAGIAGGVVGGAALFTGTDSNFVGDDGPLGPINALWMGTTNQTSSGANKWFSSPGLVLSALYNDGAAASHTVPLRFKALMTDATGTSPVTLKLMPPTDPITGTTYAGNLDVDLATNGNNVAVKKLQVTDGAFGSNQTNSSSACETSFATTTLNVGATTTDTGLNCLPANAIIDAVVYRITTTITTSANFTIGDATIAARFCGTQSTLTAGTTGICFAQADQTGTSGPRQVAAAKVRVTLNANPGAGAIRLITYYHTWSAPTS